MAAGTRKRYPGENYAYSLPSNMVIYCNSELKIMILQVTDFGVWTSQSDIALMNADCENYSRVRC